MSSTAEQYQDLQALYLDDTWQGVLHPLHYIDGIIFAVSAAPEIPLPDQWLPWCIKGRGVITDAQIERLTISLMARLQGRLNAMREEQFDLPEDCDFAANRAEEDEQSRSSVALRTWLGGLLFGHQKLASVWLSAWQHMGAKIAQSNDVSEDLLAEMRRDLSHCLRMFATFADPELAIEKAQQHGNGELHKKLPVIFKSFHLALKQYVDISGKLVGYLPNQFEIGSGNKLH